MAGGFCFAFGAASLLAGEIAVAIFSVIVGAVVGWEAAGEGCDNRACAGLSTAAVVLALVFCVAGVVAAHETIGATR